MVIPKDINFPNTLTTLTFGNNNTIGSRYIIFDKLTLPTSLKSLTIGDDNTIPNDLTLPDIHKIRKIINKFERLDIEFKNDKI